MYSPSTNYYTQNSRGENMQFTPQHKETILSALTLMSRDESSAGDFLDLKHKLLDTNLYNEVTQELMFSDKELYLVQTALQSLHQLYNKPFYKSAPQLPLIQDLIDWYLVSID